MKTRETLGWSDFFEMQWAAAGGPDEHAARVTFESRGHCLALNEQGEIEARLSGHLKRTPAESTERPAVGDWVAVRPSQGAGTVTRRLQRRTVLERAAVGGAGVQVMAANVDSALIVSSLDAELNPRRLERYLTAAWNGGVEPVLVLNKADRAGDVRPFLERLGPVAGACTTHVVSALEGTGVAALQALDRPGRTLVVVGSSGVGKSTLVNRLLGRDRQAVGAVRASDGKGRHTTTRRELLALPGGGWLIDTPGLRELGLVGESAGVAVTFPEVVEVARQCRFRDCRHQGEPGCAVESAIDRGELEAERVTSYRKQERELARARRKRDPAAERERKRTIKRLTRSYRSRPNKRVDTKS